MPFTPFHMGPGLLLKGLLQGSFSLVVFGWTQIIMDLQPLAVMVTGTGELHGFSHTYVGASLIAIVSGVSGKYFAEWLLRGLPAGPRRGLTIAWWVALSSALIGAYSHVVLDSIMHADMHPMYPFSQANSLLGLLSVTALHRLCIYSALTGGVIYLAALYLIRRRGRVSAADPHQ